MTMMIMLTEAEAEQVRGPSAIDPNAALEPIPEPVGERLMLPLSVLEDPAHAAHWDFLFGMPLEDVERLLAKDELAEDEAAKPKSVSPKPKSVFGFGRSAPDE